MYFLQNNDFYSFEQQRWTETCLLNIFQQEDIFLENIFWIFYDILLVKLSSTHFRIKYRKSYIQKSIEQQMLEKVHRPERKRHDCFHFIYVFFWQQATAFIVFLEIFHFTSFRLLSDLNKVTRKSIQYINMFNIDVLNMWLIVLIIGQSSGKYIIICFLLRNHEISISSLLSSSCSKVCRLIDSNSLYG